MTKKIAILGSTGSIGTQTLEVVDQFPELFQVEVLTAHSNISLLVKQAIQYQPNVVVTSDASLLPQLKEALDHLPIKVFGGEDALCDVAQWDSVDIVVTAIVGVAGLKSTLAAVKAGKTIALSNKETLVVAGDIVMQAAAENRAPIIPVDSEHSAIFQCLVGEDMNKIDKIILTASGGPFLGKKTNFLVNVKKSHALEHPNWNMGAKISIDSATLMNKGLEMIEAKHLFGLKNEQIEVIVHPQSIIHSLVEFTDGSLKAQLGLPDMKLPIQYALAYPERLANDNKRFNFKDYPALTFEEPDYKTFRNLSFAKDALIQGGNMPAALNAANEEVVHAFLENKIGFIEMSDVIETVMNAINTESKPDLDLLLYTDFEARKIAIKEIDKLQ